MSAKRIIVCGGNGFLGSRICKYAVARGWEVTSIRYYCYHILASQVPVANTRMQPVRGAEVECRHLVGGTSAVGS